MKNPRIATTIATSLLLLSISASAGINKCVDSAGIVSYSDQPCDTQGQKQAEVKNTTEFAMLAAKENQRKVAKACTALQERRGQCYVSIEPRLNTLFNENCEPLVKLDYKEHQREQNRRYRNRQYQQDDSEFEQEKSSAKLPCEKVEGEMYKLLKENFSSKLAPEDVRAIEYKLMAVPSNGHEPPLSTSRKRRY